MICENMKRKIFQAILIIAIALLVGYGITDYQGDKTVPAGKHATQQYVGSVNSDKYHYPDCRWAQNIKPENEIWFSSREEAEQAGYVPCQTCKP